LNKLSQPNSWLQNSQEVFIYNHFGGRYPLAFGV
jgi:hypothetical protein